MNRIEPPAAPDFSALIALSHNEHVGSFPQLKPYINTIRAAYHQYLSAKGNAFNIEAVELPNTIKNILKDHFSNPPNNLRYIDSIRDSFETRSCPMCGSLHSGTLDHLLPQVPHAAFAIYSLNLVPACKCNSKRGNVVVGQSVGQRILHPYFDDCLRDRVVSAQFSDLGPVPAITIEALAPADHPLIDAISFHIDYIVRRSGVVGYIGRRWSQLVRQPSRAVHDLRENPSTRAQLQQSILDELHRADDIHQGKNNWESMFLFGLSDDLVLDWLVTELTRLGRAPDSPLFGL